MLSPAPVAMPTECQITERARCAGLPPAGCTCQWATTGVPHPLWPQVGASTDPGERRGLPGCKMSGTVRMADRVWATEHTSPPPKPATHEQSHAPRVCCVLPQWQLLPRLGSATEPKSLKPVARCISCAGTQTSNQPDLQVSSRACCVRLH